MKSSRNESMKIKCIRFYEQHVFSAIHLMFTYALTNYMYERAYVTRVPSSCLKAKCRSNLRRASFKLVK